MLPESVLYYGGNEALPKPLELRAGPLAMSFEPHTGFLRHVRLGDHEVIRCIYGAVRDQDWATIPWQISNLQSQINKDSFQLSFEVNCRQNEVDFFWRGAVTGDASGQVSFAFDGESRSRFLRNRIGLCVLHPITECAGKQCLIEQVDGTEERGTFPLHVAPHEPFTAIHAISHEIAPGVRAEARFAGDVFEMEDQRNYGDASFKIYSTPQGLLKPVAVEAKTKVQQSVTLRLEGPARSVLPVLQGRPPQFSISTTPAFPLPLMGLGVASHGHPLSVREIERLKLLRLSHLRVDLNLSSPGFPAALQRAATEANELNAGLHIAFALTDRAEDELRAVAAELHGVQTRVLLWLVFHETEDPTGEKTARLARQLLQSGAPNALVAAGTRNYFVELNRHRPGPDAVALPCWPVSPQVHLTDERTMVDNLAGTAYAVQTAQQFSARPAVISPVTLRPRTYPNTDEERGRLARQLAEADRRQCSLFGAGWTLGSIARLATTGHVHSLTYFETTGCLGVMATEDGSFMPENFPVSPGVVYPVYHVLADIGEFPGKHIYPTHSSHPLLTDGLTLFDARGRRRVLIANLTGDVQDVKIKTGTCQARVRYLDETNAEEAMHNPESFRALPGAVKESVAGKVEIKLLPYAIARMDLG